MLDIMKLRSFLGFEVAVISNFPKDFSRKKAIELCNNTGDQRISMSTNTKILSYDKWIKTAQKGNNKGAKLYGCIFYTQSSQNVQSFTVKGDGYKTAYSNATINLNVKVKHILILFDSSQNISKKKLIATQEGSKIVQSKDVSKVDKLVVQASQSLKSFPILGRYAEDITLMLCLVKDSIRGNYTELPVGTMIGITSALVYFISPINVIPDFIPVVGQIDDAAVILWAINNFHSDIVKYKEWMIATGRDKMLGVYFKGK